jgi:hypothetical protein
LFAASSGVRLGRAAWIRTSSASYTANGRDTPLTTNATGPGVGDTTGLKGVGDSFGAISVGGTIPVVGVGEKTEVGGKKSVGVGDPVQDANPQKKYRNVKVQTRGIALYFIGMIIHVIIYSHYGFFTRLFRGKTM